MPNQPSKQDYSKEIVADEIAIVAEAFKSATPLPTLADRHNDERRRKRFTKLFVLHDGCKAGILAGAAGLAAMKKVYPNGVTVWDSATGDINIGNADFSDSAIFLIADTLSGSDEKPWKDAAQQILERAGKAKNCRCIASLAIPEPLDIPDGIESLAEREYDYFAETRMDSTNPGRNRFLELNALFRHAVRDLHAPLSVLRAVNVFGPQKAVVPGFDIGAYVRKAFDEKSVCITDADAQTIRSFTYVTDFAAASVWALFHATIGHVYNIESFHGTESDLKAALRESFPETLALSIRQEPLREKKSRCLDTLKFNGAKWNRCPGRLKQKKQMMARIASYLLGMRLPCPENIEIYRGRLPRIQSLEIDILREIDRLCEKHGIKYFLAGGSMLGALRYGHSIPWDDDLDIGFLRRDFDKFRKVCKKELGTDFVHSCYYNGTKSHYVVDKLRLKNTYFSTRYSSIHSIPDGIFIDMIVYDATSSVKPIAWFHDKLSAFCGWIVQYYWMDLRRNECANFLTWSIYKIIRLLPISCYQWVFERVITLFRFQKNPTAVIDSTGKSIGSGTIPFAGLEDVRRVPFNEGFEAPIPVDPTGYLTYDYGPDYIKEPPYCKQKAPHNFARIDLGKYLLENHPKSEFRAVDLRGELFENE